MHLACILKHEDTSGDGEAGLCHMTQMWRIVGILVTSHGSGSINKSTRSLQGCLSYNSILLEPVVIQALVFYSVLKN